MQKVRLPRGVRISERNFVLSYLPCRHGRYGDRRENKSAEKNSVDFARAKYRLRYFNFVRTLCKQVCTCSSLGEIIRFQLLAYEIFNDHSVSRISYFYY